MDFHPEKSGGYHFRPGELLALKAMVARGNGAKVLILEGPPGVGKTSLGKAFAQAIDGKEIYYLCHHWTNDEEMFIGPDIGAIAAGVASPEDAWRPGFLLRAVETSHQGPVVVLVDELDKAPSRAEALLLDFLQNGRVHGPKGHVWEGKLSNIFVLITTNGMRPLMEPTLRRGFRLKMGFLPANIECKILREKTGANPGVINHLVLAANAIREKGVSSVSLQEMAYFLEDMRQVSGVKDVEILINGWLVKEPEDEKAIFDLFRQSPASKLWGEWKRGNRQ